MAPAASLLRAAFCAPSPSHPLVDRVSHTWLGPATLSSDPFSRPAAAESSGFRPLGPLRLGLTSRVDGWRGAKMYAAAFTVSGELVPKPPKTAPFGPYLSLENY